MKMFMRRFLFELSLILVSTQFNSAVAADRNPPPQLTVELRDGSRIIGTSVAKNFKCHSELLGDLKLPVQAISSVECVATNSAKLTLVNGDALTVTFEDSTLAVKTSFGKVELAVNSINGFEVSTATGSTVRRPGLVAMWPGDGSAADPIGGNNGTLTGGVSYGPGKMGQAFVFSANGDAVQLGSPTNLWLQNFTIEAWIKRSSPTVITTDPRFNDADLFAFGYGGYGFGILANGNLFLTQVNVGNVTVGTTITDTGWHNVAVSKNGGTVVFFVDGVANPAPDYSPTFEFNTDLALGARGDNLWNGFYGAIDELKVYNRALSAGEINGDYQTDNH
jgi:hypothetical protein